MSSVSADRLAQRDPNSLERSSNPSKGLTSPLDLTSIGRTFLLLFFIKLNDDHMDREKLASVASRLWNSEPSLRLGSIRTELWNRNAF